MGQEHEYLFVCCGILFPIVSARVLQHFISRTHRDFNCFALSSLLVSKKAIKDSFWKRVLINYEKNEFQSIESIKLVS